LESSLTAIHPYASPRYALGLAHAGRAVVVPEWGSHVLARSIDGGGEDAMGIYPMAVFSPDADLAGGLERLRGEGLVSLALVPDPLTGPSPEVLASVFDVARPFKSHLTIDPAAGGYAPSKHHRAEIRRAQRRCRIEQGSLAPWLGDWTRLYRGLVTHRGVTGVADFPDAYFQALADDPTLTAFAAFVGDAIVGMSLWFAHAGVVYNHLAASDGTGYANGASFALYDTAIGHFAGMGIINLGGGAGAGDDASGGLFAFKQGLANSQVTAWLCGAILDRPRYEALSFGRGTGFFPAYRGPVVTDQA
jgi:hypothetical protein